QRAGKDVIRLLPMIDPNIKADFGGAGGIADFVKMWELGDQDKAGDSELWYTLEQILKNGGLFSNDRQTFSAPYTYANFPNSEDAYTHVIISGGGVRMRATPSLGSKIMTNLSHDIVELLDQDGPDQTIRGETYPWIYVKTRKGDDGYVWGKFIASPLDFRAIFDKNTTGNWKLTALVAGD
ncbi:MAG: SH3 domain-containing protein, partial [Bacteroidota bacterium]